MCGARGEEHLEHFHGEHQGFRTRWNGAKVTVTVNLGRIRRVLMKVEKGFKQVMP